MAVHIFTGKLGGGKTLCAVGRVKERLEAGLTVATNLDLNLEAMFTPMARKLNVIRLPDKPNIFDLNVIGRGNDTYDESKNGLLLFDECGTWFNSRSWNEKGRKEINDWFLHARKLGWDLILIIQNIKLLDSQARDALAEHTVFCSRLDRIAIPYLGSAFKMITGKRMPSPRIHTAKSVYGTSSTDLLSERWTYRGVHLFDCYDTKQLFLDDYPNGAHSLLTPWHLKGRYLREKNLELYMKLMKVYWRKFKAPLGLAAGALAGVFLALLILPYINNYLNSPSPSPAALKQEPLVIVESAQLETVVQADSFLLEEGDKEEGDKEEVEIITLDDVFKGYKILTFMSTQSKQVYFVGDSLGSTFTDEQLNALGYITSPINECILMITDANNLDDHTYVFSNRCVGRDKSAKPVDLASMPYFANQKSYF